MAAMTQGLRAQRLLEHLLHAALLLLAVVAGPVWADCEDFSLSATTPVAANGTATSAISATYEEDTSYSTTLTITGSALFNNGTQTYTQNLNEDSPINLTATNTVAQSVTVTMTNSTCTRTTTIVFANAAPTVSTSFSPATIGVNGTSTKTITLTNPNSVALTGAAFSDRFPSGLKIASPLTTSNSCGGTLSASAGGRSLDLSGGTIPASGSCSITALVTSTSTGTKTNRTGTVTTTNGLTASSVSANLTVQAISTTLSTVVASPATVAADGFSTSTITVTLRNGAGSPVSDKTVSIARSSSTNNTLTTVSGTTSSSGVATFTVKATSPQTVVYTARDSTDSITLPQTAQVVFSTVQSIAKIFTPSTVPVNGTTTLSIVLTNTSNATNLTGQTFSDNYPSGLKNTSPVISGLSGTGCTGVITGSGSGSFFGMTQGTIPKSTTCTASISVRPSVVGTLTNTVTGSAGSASATLTVVPISDALSTVVASAASVAANGTTTSTITVTLRDGASTGVANKTVQLTASGGSSVITTVSGTTNASGVATFTVKNAIAEGPIVYTARDVTDSITLSDTADVTFTELTAPAVSTSFSPSTIADAGTSTLTVTLSNPNSTAITGVEFTDNYPAGLLNDTPLVLSNSCGGITSSTVAGGSALVLSGGTIPASGSCSVSVAVTTTTSTTGASSSLNNSTGVVTSLNANDGSSASATLTTTAIDPTLSTAVASPTSVTADGVSISTITVTMVDGAGAGVPDLSVSLQPSGGSSVVTGPTSTNGNNTDENGQVTFTVKASSPQTVTYTARSTSSGINIAQQPQVVFTAPSATVTAITCATACTQTAASSTVSWNVTFSRSVTNVTAAAFSLVASGITGSSITSVTGSGTNWVVTASVGSGTGTLGLNQTGAGTVSPALTGTFTGQVYTTPTLVTAITCATACTQTSITSSVSWTVTFNRSVSSVTSAAFSLAATGLTGSSITSVTGSGTTWTVTANVGTGAGTLGLNQSGPGAVSPALSGTFTGQVYTTPATVVTSISCATSCTQTSVTGTVSWNVTFNRNVAGVSAAAFTLVPTGLSGSAITSVTGSGTSWTVTANVGTGVGTLGLNQTGPGVVLPTLTGTFTGEVYTTPTLVTAITCATACSQTAITSSVSWNVTFNRSVAGVDASVFSLAATGLTGSAITSVTGTGTSWTVTANVGTGAGTVGLNQSGPGSVSPVLGGTFTGQVYTTPATVVTAITCATSCTQTAVTGTVSWNVSFNRSVTGVDATAFSLAATGLTGSSITSVTGSGTTWTVTASVGTGVGTLGLNQSGPGSVSPVLTGTFTGQVYTTPTLVTAITCATACVQTTITTSVSWNVTFNRSVSGVDATAFSLVASGLTGSAITSVTGSGTSWTVTADVGTGAGALGLNQTGPGSVTPVLGGTFTGEVYTTPPTVVTAITCAAACAQTAITTSVSWNVTFNRSVSGVDASAFGLAATGLTGSAITSVTGSGTSWVVTADVGTGAGTLGLNQIGPGSVSPVLTGTFTGEVYTTPATVVTAITCATACAQTTITTSVSWNVTFNRSVSGVDASAFGLAATGLTGSAITSVSGSGTTWTVTADVGTGAGTLGLNQTGPGSVSPVLTGTFTGEVYTTPATVVTAITCATACVQTAITTSVSWNVTFNRSVSGVDASAFGLAATGLTGSAITSVTGSGTTWTVTADVGTGAGTLGLNQTGPGSVSPVLTGTFTGEVYTTPATVVTAITCATACVQTTITTSVSWNVTFNRSVSGVDASAFGLAATGLTGSAITSVTGSGTSWTVTADVGAGAGTLGLNQTGPGSVSPILTGTFIGEVYTTPATVVTAITCTTVCVQTTVTASVSWSVTFNRDVSGVDATVFSLVTSGISGAAITAVTGSGTTWTVTAGVGTGAGSIGLNQTGPGSVSPVLTGTFIGEVYTTPDTIVTSISCTSSCTQALTTSAVSWEVTFNRTVTGVDATAFTLASSGLTGVFISSVTGSGTTWTVTANLGVGSGTLGLDQSSAGNVSPTLTGTFTGEVYTLLTASTLALYRFDEASWTGGAGQVADSSGNGYDAQAVNGATTAGASPTGAIATDPGSCRYGVMTASSVTNGYVTTTLPNLSADFTVAGWIRSTNASTPNQRILADDAAGATGYGFSLGDGGAGKLRFYNRGLGADASFDSSYVLQSDTWYFVAAVADITGRQRSIYVFSASGELLSASSASHAAGTWGVDAGSVTIGAAQGQYFKGYLDEIQIYPRVLSEAALASLATETHACPVISGPDHFQISHGGTGVTCAASAVTLSAHNADHSIFPGYTGTVALSTSVGRGDWTLLSGSGSLANGADNDGAATYSFGGPDNGTVTLGFQDTTAETLSLNAEDGGLRETGGSADAATDDLPITFATSGFEFRADGVANDIGTQIAGKSSAVSPGAQSLQIRAIKSSDSSTACVAALQGTRTVQFAHECISPDSCSAAALRVNGGNSTTVAGNSAGSVGTYTNTVMSFDADGVASFSFTWDDAGSGRLHARYSLPLPSGAPSGSFMAGASNAFVSRPFAYHLSVTGNPAASTAGGSRFIAAGTSFEGSARAVVWSGADDSNNDGVADGMEAGDTNATNNADLSDNATTPSFSPAASITLNSSLLLPAGGAHPGITGSPVATFSNGVAAISGMRYDEAGIIEISAVQGGSYLGLGAPETAKIRGTSGYVGRFHPERFGVAANAPVFTNACAAGAFTYQGQPFYFGTAPALSLTALSAQGTTTANYTTAGFFKLTSTLAGRSYTNAAGGARTLTVVNRGGITLSGSSDGTGTATVSLVAGSGGDAFTYARAAPEAPFAASVTANFTAADLTDGDGVCLDTLDDGVCDTFSISALSGANMRYGRLVADNAMGSELDALRVPLYAQYLSGSGFLLNSADVCSVIPASALDFGVGTPSGLPAAGVLTFPVGTGSSTATFTGTPIAGQFGLILSAPGSGKTGEISLQVNLGTAGLPWLQYDWNGDGSHTDDPVARATFGTFQGPKRVVFKREVW